MLKIIKWLFANMFGKNTKIYKKPLNTLSIIFVVAFDIFLFVNLLDGYDYQKNLVISPYEKYTCTNFFNQENTSLFSQIRYFSPSDQFLQITPGWEKKYINYQNTFCKDIEKQITDIQESQAFQELSRSLSTLESTESSLNTKKYQYESQYQDFLSENSAWITDYNSSLSEINRETARNDYNEIKTQIQKNADEHTKLISTFINTNQDFLTLRQTLKNNQEVVLKNYEKEIFWYPVKVTFYQSLLLLPLFLLSLFFYKFFLRRENKIFSILFANLTFITGIFIFTLFLKIIYFILPKKFLVTFIAYLKQLSLWFLWNYISILLGLIIFGVVIYFSQKWYEKIQAIKQEQERQRIEQNKKKVLEERFAKWLCMKCNFKLLPESRFCQSCWENQYDECGVCKNLVPKIFAYCNKCWNHSWE